MGEYFVRIFVDLPEVYKRQMFLEDDFLGYRYNPNYKAKTGLVDMHINSEGIRDREHGEKNQYRIIGIGDSFTMGHAVEIDDTYLSLIEKRLPVEVIKAGVSGYSLRQSKTYLEKYGLEYDPDMIILGLHQESDIAQLETSNDYFGVYKGWLYVKDDPILEMNNHKKIRLLRGFLSQSALYYLAVEIHLKGLIYSKKGLDTKVVDQLNEPNQLSAAQEKMLFSEFEDFAILAQKNNIRFVIVIIPFTYEVLTEKKSKTSYQVLEILNDLSLKYKTLIIVDPFDELVSERKVNEILRPAPDTHYNKYGYQAMGKKIVNKIVDHVKF
jgi:hypothetical protein